MRVKVSGILVLAGVLAAVLFATPVGASAGTPLVDGGPGSSSPTVASGIPGYQPLAPARLLDTRPGGTTVDGLQIGAGAFGTGTTRALPVVDRGGVPGSGVGAVVLNVTVDQPTAGGYLTVFPTGTGRPNASNVNFTAGLTIPNLVIAKVGTGGSVSIYNHFGNTHVIVDIAGWIPGEAAYNALAPARLLDTRPGGTTVDGLQVGAGAFGTGTTRALPVVDRGGVPGSGVGAVVLNVTVDQPTAGGYLTVFPTGTGRPNASNVNFTAGLTIPNLVIAKVGTGGSVSIYNHFGNTHVIADVVGWFPIGDSYNALEPARLLDTRPGGTTKDGQQAGIGALHTSDLLNLPVSGRGGVPTSGVGAIVVNVTVDQPTTSGYLTVFGSGITPNASNLNFRAGQTIANLAIVRVSSRTPANQEGTISIYNRFGDTHVIVDVVGWIPSTPLRSITAVGAGQSHGCGLVVGGQVKCWGDNWNGLLGNNTTSGVAGPVTVVGINDATQLSVGTSHSCALVSGGVVKCWGYNSSGEVGRPVLPAITPYSYTVPGISGATAIAAGNEFSCAVVAGGQVKCWGANAAGQLGNGRGSSTSTPITVPGISGATQVSAGGNHACALVSGSVACWGSNSYGQLGDGGVNSVGRTPVWVTGLTTATSVSAGSSSTCAVVADKTVRCWGNNDNGQLGNGTTTNAPTPSAVANLSGVVDLESGNDWSCVVVEGGDVRCWGYNGDGRLGDGSHSNALTPVAPQGITGATHITLGTAHACALLPDGTVSCWGDNSRFQSGDDFGEPYFPVATPIKA